MRRHFVGWTALAASALIASTVTTTSLATAMPSGAARGEAAPPAPRTAGLAVVALDLGAGARSISEATAVDGSVVVGTRIVGDQTHAFAYNLGARHPHLVDIGVGWSGGSEAVDVERGVVVGNLVGPGQRSRAFAYDLHARHPHLVALTRGRATSIDEGVVIGDRFAIDLRAPSPTPVPLGPLGDAYVDNGDAMGVSHRVVVGTGEVGRSGNTHVFTYDLDAAQPRVVDATPDAQTAVLEAIGGSIAVGSYLPAGAAPDSPPLRFVLDLTTDPAALRVDPAPSNWTAKGTDGRFIVYARYDPGDHSTALDSWVEDLTGQLPIRRLGNEVDHAEGDDIDGGVAIGAYPSSENAPRGARSFVYDAAVRDAVPIELPRPTDSGLLPRPEYWGEAIHTHVADIDGMVAVGDANVRKGMHAVAWLLSRRTSAVLHIGGTHSVREGDLAVLTVRRTGPATEPARVRYAAYFGEYHPRPADSADLGRARGHLRFAPGQRVARIRVPVLADHEAERAETFYVTLGDAVGAVLPLSQVATVVIRPS